MIRSIACLSFLMSALALVGCNSASDTDGSAEVVTTSPPQTVGHDHDHPSEGPHGGHLIELGNEQYHAELIHPEHGHGDAVEPVVVYIVDGSGLKTAAVDATELTLNMRHDGQGEQFVIAASPEASDPPGRSSRFVSSEAPLLDLFHEEEVGGQLVVTIGGKQFRGEIAHRHHDESAGHDDHEHEGGHAD